MTRSRVGQIEAPLDPLDAHVHSIKPIRHIGILVFKTADALLYLPDIVAHVVRRATDMAQMLKNNAVCLRHGTKLSRHPVIVNHDG
jgi:hypothetical protein